MVCDFNDDERDGILVDTVPPSFPSEQFHPASRMASLSLFRPYPASYPCAIWISVCII